MTTQISTQNIQPTSLATLEGPKITNIQITNSGGTVLDDTAVALTGGYIKLTGSGFQSGCQLKVAGALATSVTFISATEVRAQVAAASAGTYDVYFTNPDGSTAIRINGLTYSATPVWVTASSLPEQAVDVAISIQLEATGATTYSLQSGSSLPSGVTLSSGGLISGTVTGIVEQTTYNFTVEAIDAELQDSPRAFSVTVTIAPQYQLYTWGVNTFGVLGLNDVANRSSPTQVGSSTGWTLISGGFYNTLAVTNDGKLYGVGNNSAGGLGLNNRITYSSPVQISSDTNWARVSSFRPGSTIATKTNGTLWAWGGNEFGQLGLGDTIARSSPVQIGTGTNWNLISIKNYICGAIKTDGTLWTWGQNGGGQLGLNDRISRSSPMQVGSATDWSKISSGWDGMAAIKTNGTLWLWGDKAYGQNGLNDLASRSSPTQVGTGTNWTLVAKGRYSSAAIKTDGTLWTWGWGYSGKLGLGNTIHRSSPVQVGAGTNWANVDMFQHTAATKTDGTLWLWGYNGYGQLGLNDRNAKSSPTQVGSSTGWTLVGCGFYTTVSTKEV